jgi:hypothetical protein
MHINVTQPTIVYQENQSNILIAQSGGNFKRASRHTH